MLLALAGAAWLFRSAFPTDPQSSRPPQLFGTVDAVKSDGRGHVSLLITCRRPPLGTVESSQNQWERRLAGPHMWVVVHEKTRVLNDTGGGLPIVAGQTVSAWCSGPIAKTYPPQRSAELVVVEAE